MIRGIFFFFNAIIKNQWAMTKGKNENTNQLDPPKAHLHYFYYLTLTLILGHKNCPNKRPINISRMCTGVTLMTGEHMLGSFAEGPWYLWLPERERWARCRCGFFLEVIPHRWLRSGVKGAASAFIFKFHVKNHETIPFIYFQDSWADFGITSSSIFENLIIHHTYIK